MFKALSIVALGLFVGFAAVGCGAEDPYAGEDADALGEVDEALWCTNCEGGGEYPSFDDYRGPVGGIVDYYGSQEPVLMIGTVAPTCPAGEDPVRNRYGRWICV